MHPETLQVVCRIGVTGCDRSFLARQQERQGPCAENATILQQRTAHDKVTLCGLRAPRLVWMSAFAVFSGTGTVTTRLSAYSLSLKLAFSLTLTSRRVRPSSLTIGSTLNGRLMPSCN